MNSASPLLSGVLLIDKPAGPTSHDAVARIRRVTGQRDIGHTGTLDPRATGLLPLVVGRATKLASLLTGGDKTYEAAIRLGFATETDDGEGQQTGAPAERLPSDAEIETALGGFRGTFDQVPPQHSAKKVQGARAYELARRAETVPLEPVSVTVRALDWLGRSGDLVQVRVVATSGFYVRALARDLGARLGCGGHLAALRRTGSGTFRVEDAIGLEAAEALGPDLPARLIPPAEALPHLGAVRVTALGLKRVTHGNPLGPEHVAGGWIPPVTGPAMPLRVLGEDGRLVAIAHSRGGILHPVAVLG